MIKTITTLILSFTIVSKAFAEIPTATNPKETAKNASSFSTLIPGDPVIGEFVANNLEGFMDEEGDAEDWIEITNHSSTIPVVINNNYFLTDDQGDLTKWAIPNQTIAPGASIVIFASNKQPAPSNLHANFSLQNSGEYLALIKSSGGTTTILTEFNEYPRQFLDVSYGANADFSSYLYYTTPTPNNPNTGASFADYVRDTSFSINRGFYDTTQSVAITTSTPDAMIYYTTDGSEPTTTNGIFYDNEISISTTTILRAIATKDGFLPTNVDTNTYLFLDGIIDQPGNPTGWPTGSVNGQIMDYHMDPGTAVGTNDAGIKSALTAIPSISLVTDQANLTNPSTGIYVNARNRGINWERAASVELILPPGYISPDGHTDGFQVDAGLRIRGGFSRIDSNPKHAFRLFFRRKYGDSTLDFPLFGNEGTNEFQAIDLRTAQNYSWSFKGPGNSVNQDGDNSRKNTFLREIAARDTQRALGQPYTRSRYYHLYVNKLYWGLFMTQERSEADFAASYFGGTDDDYDTIKSSGRVGSYTTEVTDGFNTEWMIAYNMAIDVFNSAATSNLKYTQIQGLNLSGVRDEARPVHIDVENLIGYMLVVFYHASFDSPLSEFVKASNNWFALRNREAKDRGWLFFAHDMEHSMGSWPIRSIDRTGPFWFNQPGNTPWRGRKNDFSRTNPQYIHQHLMKNNEYRLKFADIVHRTFFNDGPLTDDQLLARIKKREQIVDQVIHAEAARWGDSKSSSPLRKTSWIIAVNQLKNWIKNTNRSRNASVLQQLINDDLYPSANDNNAPVFSRHGGTITSGFTLTVTNPNSTGTVYYTIDGPDPRTFGGGNVGTALAGPIVLNEAATIRARVRKNTTDWSPLTTAIFVTGVTPAPGELIVSEINYHPANPTQAEIDAGAAMDPPSIINDDDDFEFIEITNVTNKALDLTNVILVSGEINHAFGPEEEDAANLVIAAGTSIVVPRRSIPFRIRYPGVPNIDDYAGRLSNRADTVTLKLNDGTILFSVTYNDANGWPEYADGNGYSLILANQAFSNDPNSWRLSTAIGGNPAISDSNPFVGSPTGDLNNNGIANLVEAILQDDTGRYIAPEAGIMTDTGANYLTMTIHRYLPVDNATVTVERSLTLDGAWATDAIERLSSIPQGNGTVIEVYRLTTPVTAETKGFLRIRTTLN